MNNAWLAHHGILGQKWGVRRFQNKDGSLTAAGEKHVKENRMSDEDFNKASKSLLESRDRRDAKHTEINKRMDEEIAKYDKIKPKNNEWWKKTGPGPNDYRMSGKAKKYLNVTDKVVEKYSKEIGKVHEQWQKEEDELSKKVFNDPRLKTKVKELHDLSNSIDKLRHDMLSEDSKAYKDAWKKYCEENKRVQDGPDDDSFWYGFDHYTWRTGNKDYDNAVKAYNQASAEITKQYKSKLKEAGEIMCQGFMDQIDKKHGSWMPRTYRLDAEDYIDSAAAKYEKMFGKKG